MIFELGFSLKVISLLHPWVTCLPGCNRNTGAFVCLFCDYFAIKFGGRVGLVVSALAFHQCGPGSISALGVICGLSLLVLHSAMRGFPPGTPVSPLTKNQHLI